MREGCGQSARCLSCLGEQTGSRLWWRGDQSGGRILRGRAKVAAVHTLLPCCAPQLGDPEYTQRGSGRRVCLCVCVGSTPPTNSSHTRLCFPRHTHSNSDVQFAVVWKMVKPQEQGRSSDSQSKQESLSTGDSTNLALTFSVCHHNPSLDQLHVCFVDVFVLYSKFLLL